MPEEVAIAYFNTEPRPWYEKVQILALGSTQISAFQREGFTVKLLSAKNPLLDISYSSMDLSQEKMTVFEPPKNHITWLSLSGTNIENDWLSVVSGFPNLARLELDKTQISDEGVAHLKGLPRLEVLNLYASQVSDASLPMLQELPELKRVYLSETKVTPEKAKDVGGEDSELSLIIASNQNSLSTYFQKNEEVHFPSDYSIDVLL